MINGKHVGIKKEKKKQRTTFDEIETGFVWRIAFVLERLFFPDTFRNRTNVILYPWSTSLSLPSCNDYSSSWCEANALCMNGSRRDLSAESSFLPLSSSPTVLSSPSLRFILSPSVDLKSFLFLNCNAIISWKN